MTKDWMSKDELMADTRVFSAFTLVLLGMAIWECAAHISFDLQVLTGRRKFRWPMIIYFVCRLCLIAHACSMAVTQNAIYEIPCMPVIWIGKVADAIGTCGSSLILALRTRAVWGKNWKITAALGALFAGQIVLWCQTFRYSRSHWDPIRAKCTVDQTAPQHVLVAVFSYTMVFDLIILVLCTMKLRTARLSGGIATLLMRDGIAYFCAVFVANLVQTVMGALNLNPVMNIMCLPLAVVVSVIASTTVFRNVFTLHDAWADAPGSSGAPAKPSSGNYAGGQGLSLRRLPRPAPTHYDLPSFVSAHGGDGVFAENISLAELASPDSKETIAFPSGTTEK